MTVHCIAKGMAKGMASKSDGQPVGVQEDVPHVHPSANDWIDEVKSTEPKSSP
jgi:hypothetical protein